MQTCRFSEFHGRQFDGPGEKYRRGNNCCSSRGDLSRKITVDVKGIFELKNTINTMVDQLNAFKRRSTAQP